MPKTATDPGLGVLTGATMGTAWQVRVDDPLSQAELEALSRALQAAVDEVDSQMSTWKADSDLMRFNAAELGVWIALPAALMEVLQAGLAVSELTDGAFEMNVGEAVRAWGFGPERIALEAIRAASAALRVRAVDALRLDRAAGLACKTAALTLDLSGIAKGYGVDRLAETLMHRGVAHALCAIDGEVRAIGARATGAPWAIGIDAPDGVVRGDHSVILLADAAVATSGDYRHYVTVAERRLSHTMNPLTRAPMVGVPASVTVMGQSCMMADAMATALMVLGPQDGLRIAAREGIHALILRREAHGLQASATGLFLGFGDVDSTGRPKEAALI